MREIKFRGVRIDNAEWVYGFYSVVNINHGIWARIKSEFPEWYQVHPESVGQFTGLKDCKGKDIYEGDIIRYNEDAIRVITFRNGAFHAEVHNWKPQSDMPTFPIFFLPITNNHTEEIIGNIHQHSELLK